MLYTGGGNDSIQGDSNSFNSFIGGNTGILNEGKIETEAGDDTIIGTSLGRDTDGIINRQDSIIDMGSGNDYIFGKGARMGYDINNFGTIDMGSGKDTLTGTGQSQFIKNNGTIDMGSGNDALTGGEILNGFQGDGIIDMGNGDDSIESSTRINNLGTIEMGNGEDTVTAEPVFDEQGFFGSGSVFLGNGKDILSGFGSGNFFGGRGKDTLILPEQSYTVGVADNVVTFTNSDITMTTQEFEILNIGDMTYNFADLADGIVL